MTDWISGQDAAVILGISRTAVWRTLVDEAARAETWGAEGVGWRRKPLSRRGIFQVSRARAEELAAGPDDHPEE